MTTINNTQQFKQTIGSFSTIQAWTPCAIVFNSYNGLDCKHEIRRETHTDNSWFYDNKIKEEINE